MPISDDLLPRLFSVLHDTARVLREVCPDAGSILYTQIEHWERSLLMHLATRDSSITLEKLIACCRQAPPQQLLQAVITQQEALRRLSELEYHASLGGFSSEESAFWNEQGDGYEALEDGKVALASTWWGFHTPLRAWVETNAATIKQLMEQGVDLLSEETARRTRNERVERLLQDLNTLYQQAFQLEKKGWVIKHPCIDQLELIFPGERMNKALRVFRSFLQDRRREHGTQQTFSPEQELAYILSKLGWNSVLLQKGGLVLTEYTGRELDLEHNPVLVGAVGLVAPGSFVVGHAAHEFGPTWWVSYTLEGKQIHQGVPTQEQLGRLLVCSACGSLNPREWHHVQYTAIRYPVDSVNPEQITTISQAEVLYECVIKEYVQCCCGAELVRDGRTIV